MAVPEEVKRWMIDNNISVVDLNWKAMRESGVDFKEVLKWELANKHLFNSPKSSKEADNSTDIQQPKAEISCDDINSFDSFVKRCANDDELILWNKLYKKLSAV